VAEAFGMVSNELVTARVAGRNADKRPSKPLQGRAQAGPPNHSFGERSRHTAGG